MTERVFAAAKSAGAMGERVIYQPDGESYELFGIWDDDQTDVALDFDTPVTTTNPVLSVAETDLRAGPVCGVDQLRIRDRFYLVVEIRQDGQGTLDLELNELEDPA